MEIINPRITIENTDVGFWLVRMEQRLSDHEHMDIRLKVLRTRPMDVGQLQAQLLTQASTLIAHMQGSLAAGTPDADKSH